MSCAPGQVDRSEHLGVFGQPGQGQESSRPSVADPRHQQCGRRWEVCVAALGEFAGREPAGIDPDQGLQRPPGALPHRDHRAAVGTRCGPARRRSASGAGPPRPPADRAAAAAAGCPAGPPRRSRTPPAARPRGWPPRSSPCPGTRAATLPPTDWRTGVCGKRLAQLLRGPLGADDRGADAARSADRALPVDLGPAAPAAAPRRTGLLVVRARTGGAAAECAPGRLAAALQTSATR